MAESIGNSGKGMKLHTKILLGLLVGAVVGIAANQMLGGDHAAVVWVNKYLAGPIGQIFLRMLFMIVIPLVFASIALGVAGLGDLGKAGRVGGKAIAYFFASTALAATLGLIIVAIVRPGESLAPETRESLLQTYATEASSRVQAAAASTRIPADKAKPMIGFLEALNEIVIKIVGFAMRIAPYGVAGLIFGVTSRFGFHLLKPLAAYILVVLGALLIHVLVNISAILKFLVGISPILFFKRIRSALVTAFSTSSSSGTLPTALAVAEQNLRIPPQIAGFVLPLGSTMCMNGTALFEGITVIFLCQVFGVDLSMGQMVVVMIMSVITGGGGQGVLGDPFHCLS